MFRKFLLPDLYKETVSDIDYKKLYEKGIRLIIFDIDNTLKTYGEKVPSNEIKELFNRIKAENIKLCLVSNGRKSRVDKFNEDIKLDAFHLSLKPIPFNVIRMIKKQGFKRKETVLIGDQIFTDVLAGKFSFIKTILVKPIEPKKTKSEKIKRKLEKSILKLYNKD
ncbi:MAG: YqeG family HAD IIIA-type phosphatase [Clostridia bacterium]|nr:YqeG family HAD IIIA-type phosphatase [Clostridia bacterium]